MPTRIVTDAAMLGLFSPFFRGRLSRQAALIAPPALTLNEQT
jgi:hypothetical protein